ncbi:GNAT family N-acetyltransferase [Epibacterium sp. Ofav1-8]|uniref:GNAT family N-acetyltransferase n=1 Tax=Epibacterium sp. Ofav1-8 TaxID=2917735 RepID=UPI001EF4B9B0|nr:GNAT family N-acetyltransferase [Epibacterium sp. Ofav1-8]MCG7623053.1 GNAT family N-acetyltransferase [Epibacterium sp. Ofav1-8]
MKIEPIGPDRAASLVPLLQDLHALHVAHQPERHTAQPSTDHLCTWLEDWLAQPGIHALAAVSPQDAIMGYLIYELEDRPALPVRPAERRAMVHHITVAPALRRIGVGKALMTRMKHDALEKGADVIGVTYAPFNVASAALMRHFGLEPVITMAEWRAEPHTRG